MTVSCRSFSEPLTRPASSPPGFVRCALLPSTSSTLSPKRAAILRHVSFSSATTRHHSFSS
eukprot:1989604-Rhodomonas_salina.1